MNVPAHLGAAKLGQHAQIDTQPKQIKDVAAKRQESFAVALQALQSQQSLASHVSRVNQASRAQPVRPKTVKRKAADNDDDMQTPSEVMDPAMVQEALGHHGPYSAQQLHHTQSGILLGLFANRSSGGKDDEEE